MKRKLNQSYQSNRGKQDTTPYRDADRKIHVLDELYRMVGLAPLHAYQAARADLESLRGGGEDNP